MSDFARSLDDEQVLGKAYDWRLVSRMWAFVRPHWKLLLLALVLIPIAIGFELAQPILLKIAIDTNVRAHTTDGLGTLALLFVLFVVLQALAKFAQLYALQLLGQRSMHDLRLATYRHVITRRTAFYDKIPTGRLLTRMTNDVESINEMFASGVVTLIADVVMLVAIVVMMFALNVKLTLMTFLTLPVLVVLLAWARSIMRRSFREIRVKLAAMNAYVAEHLSGIRVVQLFLRERRAHADYDELNAAYRDAYLGAIKADAGMYAVVEALGVCSAAAIAWYTGANIANTSITIGLVVVFIEYVNKFFIPIRDFSAKYTVMQSAMAAMERIVSLLDTDEPDAVVDPAATPAEETDGAPIVELRDVEFSYRPGEPILRGVSFDIPAGSTVAVVGATGSGKSTLVRLLTRLYEPSSGQILFRGRNVRSFSPDELRSRIAVVTQDVHMFSGSLADNVRLGRLDATRDDIDAALARVGADRVLARRDAGADEEVAERGQNFSAGERQLVAFARALVRNAELLILDEATANVDPEAEAAIERGLQALLENRTTFVIAHRLSTIRNADQIIVLSRGVVAEQGTRDELVAHGGLYARLERTFARH